MTNKSFFCPICRGLTEPVIDDILAHAQMKRFKNQSVYLQGDSFDGLYIVATGKIRLTSNNSEGNGIFVKLVCENNTFGESGIADSKYLENAYAVGPAACAFICDKDLKELMKRHNSLSLSMLASMGQWLAEYYNRFMTLSLHSVRNRLEFYLNDQAKKRNTNEIELGLRKHEVASNLGVRPETLSRTIKQLEEDGLITQSATGVNVTELARKHKYNSES